MVLRVRVWRVTAGVWGGDVWLVCERVVRSGTMNVVVMTVGDDFKDDRCVMVAPFNLS